MPASSSTISIGCGDQKNLQPVNPQSGWFEDTPLKGGTEEGCPLKGVHEGTLLIEVGPPAWNHFRASGLTMVSRLGLLCGAGSGTPPQVVLSSHSTPERQSLFESHRQRRWLTRWSYGHAPQPAAVDAVRGL